MCACSQFGERVRVILGGDTVDLLHMGFSTIKARNEWLELSRCNGCGRPWYVAIDTVDDDYYFRGLTAGEVESIVHRDEWPPDFDDFVNVWPLDGSRNFEARLHWPWKDQTFQSL